jgi:nitrogen-specific signal transduction histidine kinase
VADTIAHAVFGLLFESSADAAFIVEQATNRIVSANVRAADLLACDVDGLVGASLSDLAFEDRDLASPGHYEDVALRRRDDYPVYVELHVAFVDSPEHGVLLAYMARDTSERRNLERELVAKHSALFTAYADLEKAHAQLSATKRELETRNQEIAMLAWRAATGELVAGIAHHLNNPVGALASTARRLAVLVQRLPDDARGEWTRLLVRIEQVARRIETNVAAIVHATHSSEVEIEGREVPPELRTVLATFVQRLDEIPTKEPS